MLQMGILSAPYSRGSAPNGHGENNLSRKSYWHEIIVLTVNYCPDKIVRDICSYIRRQYIYSTFVISS